MTMINTGSVSSHLFLGAPRCVKTAFVECPRPLSKPVSESIELFSF